MAHKVFYGATAKANLRAPASTKNPRTTPFAGMVRASWVRKYHSDSVMELHENFAWWNEFKAKIQDGDLSENDLAYLAEVESDSDSDSGEIQDSSDL